MSEHWTAMISVAEHLVEEQVAARLRAIGDELGWVDDTMTAVWDTNSKFKKDVSSISVTSGSGKSKGKGKKKKDPNAPKKNLNPYNYYCKDEKVRADVKKKHPDEKNIMPILGSQWSGLSDEKKIDYVKLAKKDAERYKEEMEKYKNEKHDE